MLKYILVDVIGAWAGSAGDLVWVPGYWMSDCSSLTSPVRRHALVSDGSSVLIHSALLFVSYCTLPPA